MKADGESIRLWTRNGSASRNKTSLYESGSGIWVEPDKAIPLEMFDCSEDGIITLYIEAVSGSMELGDIDIRATLDPDGPATNAPAYASLTDHVVATVFHIDNVRPIAEDFVAGHEGQIMISTKHCTTNTPNRVYTSAITTAAGTPAQVHNSDGSHNRNVTATAYIKPIPPEGALGFPALRTYFEVTDPDDRSPYDGKTEPTDSSNHWPNDNRDPDKRIEWDQNGEPSGYEDYQDHCIGVSRMSLAHHVEIDGVDRYAAEITLDPTDRYAGDNYQIRATLRKPDYTNEDGRFDTHTGMNTNDSPYTYHASTIQETIPLVSWKRVYIEQDHMYTLGATIVSDAPAQATELNVDDSSDFTSPFPKQIDIFWKSQSVMTNFSTVIVGKIGNTLTVPAITNSIPAYAGIKPQGHTATYELSRDFMPQAYGSDPQGIDGGAFIEFRDAPTGNDTNGVPKYHHFPEALNTNIYPGVVNAVDQYNNAWFDNFAYRLQNVAYLLAANSAVNTNIAGWHWRGGVHVFLSNPLNSSVLGRENSVIHEMGHRMGLSPPSSPPDLPNDIGPNYAHIDQWTSVVTVTNWCNSDACIMNYKDPRTEQGRFCIDCLILGSGGTNYSGQVRMDSLRTGPDN